MTDRESLAEIFAGSSLPSLVRALRNPALSTRSLLIGPHFDSLKEQPPLNGDSVVFCDAEAGGDVLQSPLPTKRLIRQSKILAERKISGWVGPGRSEEKKKRRKVLAGPSSV
jgi:hypothetical protein